MQSSVRLVLDACYVVPRIDLPQLAFVYTTRNNGSLKFPRFFNKHLDDSQSKEPYFPLDSDCILFHKDTKWFHDLVESKNFTRNLLCEY